MNNILYNLSSFLKNKKVLILGAIILSPIILSLIYALFNRFDLSTQPTTQQSGPNTWNPIPKPAQDLGIGKILCPSTQEFCDNGKSITKDNLYLGYGAKLPESSPVTAVFDGEISTLLSATEGEGTMVTLFLISNSGNQKAVYKYLGEPPSQTSAIKGDNMQFTGRVIPEYGASLVFTLLVGPPDNQKRVELTPEDFTEEE